MRKLKKSVIEPENEEQCRECNKIISKQEYNYNDGFCTKCLTNYYEEFGQPKE